MPSKDQILALVQSLAMIGGSLLAGKGLLSADQAAGFSNEVLTIAGGILALGGLLGNHLNADAPATPGVK